MLSLYRHQRIETLAERLEEHLRDELNGQDAFYQPTIAVGSRAMERFVSEQLARGFGVASNLRFMRPAELLHRLVDERLGETVEGLRAWDPSSLRFAILHELPALMELEEAAFLENYLAFEESALIDAAMESEPAQKRPHGRRALLLATELADILDRLIHYRPEETRLLRRGEIPKAFEGDPAARFFQFLLARLEARLGETHLLALLETLTHAPPPEGAGGTLHLFGLSYLPPLHLQLLRGFAETRPIHAYLISPFEHFIERDYFLRSERDELSAIFHPLLAAWGSLGADFLHRLHEGAEGVDDHLIEAAPEPDHLLGRLRADLRGVKEPSVYEGDDWNIEIHSTFGMLRQVEALRDRLLHLFSEEPDLKPREIAILTPDPDRFGPLIEAVFGQREPGLPSIPITLTDNSLASLSEAGALLIQLFELANVRVTLPGLAALFELRGLSSRFGIAEDQQGELREILAMSMMRCHLDLDDPAADERVPISGAHTIRAGLRRIILGSLMRDPEESGDERDAEAEIVRDHLPLGGLDAERLELIHQLLGAIDTILGFIPELRRARGLDDWLQLIARIFEALLPPLDLGAEGVLYQLGQLRLEYEASLAPRGADDTNGDEERDAEPPLIFSSTAFAYELERRLDDSSDHPVGRRGGVIVSRLTPMRALPFRVIALLGLDESRFPRRARHHALDLVAKKSRPGDRLAGREDRHLLFEALLAARDRLMIFYTGRDATTNEAIPPSVPVAELLDVLKAMNGEPGRALVEEHPLHPFSPRLFSDETPALIRPYSSSAHRGAIALTEKDDRKTDGAINEAVELESLYASEEPERALVEIDLDDLIRFFRNPARVIARRTLRVALPEESLSLDDREPLEADFLAQYQLRDLLLGEVLASGLDEESLHAAGARLDRIRGAKGIALPHRLDEPRLADAQQFAALYREALHKLSAAPLELAPLKGIRLVSDGEPEGGVLYSISGAERFQMGDELILATASSSAERVMLEAWLLLAFTDDTSKRARVLYRSGTSIRSLGVALKSRPGDAHLIRLIRVYLGLDRERFPTPVKPSFAVAKALLNDPDDKAGAMMRGEQSYLASSFSGAPSEAELPENIAVYRGSPFADSSPFYAPALALIEDLHLPCLEAETKG